MATMLTDRLYGATSSLAVKAPCRAATTASITLSGLQEIDGIEIASGDRILVKNQTNQIDNGIWVVAEGAWSRAPDFDGTRDVVRGTQVIIAEGVLYEGNSFFVSSNAPVIGQDAISFSARIALSVVSTPYKNIKDYGAVGDGVTDDTASIQAALAGGGPIVMPAGEYKISSTLNISASNTVIKGAGRGATVLLSSASGHTINVATGLSYIELHDFSATRPSHLSISGQDGIHFTNLTERAIVERVEITRHWRGLKLGITSFSKVIEVLCDNNYSHGIHVTNEDGAGGLQWTLINCLSQRSNGYGLLYSSPAGSASVGEILNFSTWANKLGGAWFAGTDLSHSINSVRWSGGFVGEDGNHGIYINSYGVATHHISNVFSEIAGTAACGVDNGTSATHVGNGINLTRNNASVEMIGCHVIGNSYSGISSEADRALITGCGLRINGAAAVPGERNGILLNRGNACVSGCSVKGHAGFGVFLQNDNHIVVGNDLTENTTGPLGAAVPLVVSKTSPNLGM